MCCARRLVPALALMVATAAAVRVPAQSTERPTVVIAELDGIIHPIAAEYLTGVIDDADTSNAELVVVVLRTPGGLLESTRTIVSRIISSRAPVVVFVGPSGARAASAGFILTLAADVAAMAPGTHIGAAHPVSGDGQKMDQTVSPIRPRRTPRRTPGRLPRRGTETSPSPNRRSCRVVPSPTRRRHAPRHRSSTWSPPTCTICSGNSTAAPSSVSMDGQPCCSTREPHLRSIEMSRRQRFLGAIAHPQIAYLLLTLGILGLTVELWNPGAVLPGVAGGLCLLLAFFAFQVLPVNAAGLLLILFGIGTPHPRVEGAELRRAGRGWRNQPVLRLAPGNPRRSRRAGRTRRHRAGRARSFGRRAAARSSGTGGAAAAAGHRRRRADRSAGAGAIDDRPRRVRISWRSTASCGGQRATLRSRPADSFA